MEIGSGGSSAPSPPVATGRTRIRTRARRIAIPVAVALGLAATGWFALGSIARSVARSRFRNLGLDFQAASARVRFFSVRFEHVSMSSEKLPDVVVALDHVDVRLGASLGIRRVEVHGGRVRLTGRFDELRDELDAFRGEKKKEHESEPGPVFPITVDGVDVAYAGRSGEQPSLHIWGGGYERSRAGGEVLRADLLRLGTKGASVEAANARAEVSRDRSGRRLERVGVKRLDATVDLDERGLLSAFEQPENGGSAAASGAAPLRPALLPLADREPEGPRLREAFQRFANDVLSILKPDGKIDLAGARFALNHDGETLNIGPSNVVLVRIEDRVRLEVLTADKAAAPLRFEVAGPAGSGIVSAALAGGPVSLAAVGVREGDMGLRDVDRAEIDVDGRAELASDGRSMALSGRAELENLSVFQPKLASDVVRGLRLALSGKTSFDLDGSRIDLEGVEVGVGRLKVHANGHLERDGRSSRGALHADVPLAACADVLASTPPGLVPLLAGLETAGTFAFSGDLTFDTRHPDNTRVESHVENECRITRVPEAISPGRFLQTWVRSVPDGAGGTTTLESGPGSPNWVSLPDISPFVQTAVVVCEDSRFWYHGGFDEKAIHDSIRDNLRAGSFVRGASTVSMQLAKNLFLGREKTLSRKLQEAVLTLLLEQTLTKEQILELYLNVIEFFPGLYGIGPAAAHYFHSTPRDLSLAQSLYLISVLPNPKVQHFDKKGALTETWTNYLHHLMEIAHKIRKIDDHQLEVGLAEMVHFGVPSEDAGSGDSENPTDRVPENGYAPDADDP